MITETKKVSELKVGDEVLAYYSNIRGRVGTVTNFTTKVENVWEIKDGLLLKYEVAFDVDPDTKHTFSSTTELKVVKPLETTTSKRSK